MSIIALLDKHRKRGIAPPLDLGIEFVAPMPMSCPRSHRHHCEETPPPLPRRAPPEEPAPAAPAALRLACPCPRHRPRRARNVPRQREGNTYVSSGIFVWALAEGRRQKSQSIIHGTAQGPILHAPTISKGTDQRGAGAPRPSCCPGGGPVWPPPCCWAECPAAVGPSPGVTPAASAPGTSLLLPGAVKGVRSQAGGWKSAGDPCRWAPAGAVRLCAPRSSRAGRELRTGSRSGYVIPRQPLNPLAEQQPQI